MEIAKYTLKSLLDTFHHNDFFNIIFFNDNLKNASCSQRLIQALSRNKEMVREIIDTLEPPKENGDIFQAFRKAFESLDNIDTQTTSVCEKAIMIVTDSKGYSSELLDLLEELNPAREVRIFTYKVGTGQERKLMKSIACLHRGKFYEFLTLSKY